MCKDLHVKSSVNLFLTGEHSAGALEPKLPQLHFVKGAEYSSGSSLRVFVSHPALCNVLQLSSEAGHVTLSPSHITRRVIHNFKPEQSLCGHYLFTEDQLVIEEEEDSLLAASIRLIDP